MDIHTSAPFAVRETSRPRTTCELVPGAGAGKLRDLEALATSTFRMLDCPLHPENLPMFPFLSPFLPVSPRKPISTDCIQVLCFFHPEWKAEATSSAPRLGSEQRKSSRPSTQVSPKLFGFPKRSLPAVTSRLFRISVGNYSELVERGQVARG